jgi:branched-chain amino acid transport system ATP-binding protein
MSALLRVEDLCVRFGGLAAVDHASFTVQRGHIHALIGPNGAGKTTVFNIISGLVRHNHGMIFLGDQRIDQAAVWERTRYGLARTFQNIRLFGDMSVLENVMTGAHTRINVSLSDCILRSQKCVASETHVSAQAHARLEFVGLKDAHHRRAGDLSYGDQRRVEIARALMAEPSLLMLDEPAAGLNPAETQALAQLILRLRDEGITILIVEHDMPLVMGISDALTVLNFGRIIAQGPPHDIRHNPHVIEAYLGSKLAQAFASASASHQEGRHE